MTNIAVIGAAGRMGRILIESILVNPNAKLTAAIEQPGMSVIGADAGEVAGVGNLGVTISDSLQAVLEDFDVLIDFTVAAATEVHIGVCANAGKKLVIGTTGLSQQQNALIVSAGEKVAIIYAPNYSVGVNATLKLLDVAARIFGDSVDIEITEAHHRGKVDAPSGTALKMGEVIANALGRNLDDVAIYGREGQDRKSVV